MLSRKACWKMCIRDRNRSKEIIYFELVGLALIDGEYEEKEVEFLEEVGSK